MAIDLDIHKQLDKFRLDIHLHTDEKKLCLFGPSGAGKTMTLNCIAGLETPDEGYIRVNDTVYFHSEEKCNVPPAKRKIGYVFQNYALFPHMTVMQNILFGLRHLPKKQQLERGEHFLEIIRLTALKDHYPSHLSGGQQQRVALARSLILEPDVLLMDEPFSALDYSLKRELKEELLTILANYKGQTVFVTHNLEEAYDICDSIAVYSEGHILALDKKTRIFPEPPQVHVSISPQYAHMAGLLRLD